MDSNRRVSPEMLAMCEYQQPTWNSLAEHTWSQDVTDCRQVVRVTSEHCATDDGQKYDHKYFHHVPKLADLVGPNGEEIIEMQITRSGGVLFYSENDRFRPEQIKRRKPCKPSS